MDFESPLVPAWKTENPRIVISPSHGIVRQYIERFLMEFGDACTYLIDSCAKLSQNEDLLVSTQVRF